MSASRSIRKSVPYSSNPSSDSMFYNYSPSMTTITSHQPTIRSPLAEETDIKSPDFVWEAEYQDKMGELENSISQVPSSEKRRINFQFIDDMKATFDLKSMHNKRKRPTQKQIPVDSKAATRKDRKGGIKLPENNKKRRPRNAFILYRTVLQAKAEFKGKTQTELSRLIATCWQNEPPETRAHFERAAELEKAFGYGATDIFNIKVGPAEKDWDTEGNVDQGSAHVNSELDEIGSDFAPNQDGEFQQPINYPMSIQPYSPHFEQYQQDPYQIQASFQMLGSPYTDSPVYAGTPCGQINLSPQQAMFPFNTYPIDSTPDQGTPLSPQDYDRPSSAFYAGSIEQPTSNVTPAESFALQTSAPEVSDIPADYAFEGYHMDYNQHSTHSDTPDVNTNYSSTVSDQESYHAYNSGNSEMFSPTYHEGAHHTLENAPTSDHGIYMQPQYPISGQGHLEGSFDLGGQMFNENTDYFAGHTVPHYQ